MRLSNDHKVERDHNVLYYKETKNKYQSNNKAITNLVMSFDVLFPWTYFSFHYVLTTLMSTFQAPFIFIL